MTKNIKKIKLTFLLMLIISIKVRGQEGGRLGAAKVDKKNLNMNIINFAKVDKGE